MARVRVLVKALLALVGLLAVIAGIPVLLTVLAGSPIPQVWPTPAQVMAAVQHPDDGTLLIGVLKYIGWAAWLSFTGSVLTQLVAQVRHIQAPRIPGFVGAPVAARLVATILAVGAITSVASPVGAAHAVAAPTDAPSPATTTSQTVTVTEQVPHAVTVVRGDTLSEISEHELGKGSQWPVIFQANKGAPQGHGQHLTNPDLIYPGLQLVIPGKTDTITRTITVTTPTTPTDTIPAPATPVTPAQPASPLPDTQQRPQQPAPVPTAAPQPAAVSGASRDASRDVAALSAPGQSVVRTVAGLGSLAAAGALVLLARRRARQSRTRGPGQRIALPAGDAAVAEAQLRAAADPITVDALDRAMRTLAHNAGVEHIPVPALRAARITPDGIELYLAEDDARLPAPARPVEDEPGTWAITRDQIEHQLLAPDAAAAVPAPWPTLVTLGHDEHQAHLLVHLEELRTLAVTGDSADEVLSAITLELIACQWADDVTVTLVGILPELAEAIGSDRVTYVDELEHILTALEYAATQQAHTMTEAGTDTPHAARAAGLHSDTWTPHLVVTGAEPEPAQADRIRALLHTNPRTAFAAITRATSLGEWQLHVDRTDHAMLHPVQIELTAQHLSHADLSALLDAFRTTEAEHLPGPAWTTHLLPEPPLHLIPEAPTQLEDTQLEDTQLEDTQLEDLDAICPEADVQDDTEAVSHEEHLGAQPTPTLSEDGVQATETTDSAHHGAWRIRPRAVLPTDRPVLRLLGPVRVDNPQGKRPESPGTALKILTHLALHPGGSHEQLDQAVWPGQDKRSTTRAAPISATRKWLGYAPDGHPYLAVHTDHDGYRLADDMPVDWDIFRELIGADIAGASLQQLVDALGLVYGKPLTGPRIAETPAEEEIIATVADVAHEVAARALRDANPALASWAAGIGLQVEPVAEHLWRDQLRAAHQAGQPGRIHELITRLDATMDPIGGDLEPETEDLIHQLTA